MKTQTLAPILITGVGKRIGLALADSLLQQGQPVIGTYRTPRSGLQELEQQGAQLVQLDLYQRDQVTALIKQILEQHSRLRGIIHNASDWLPEASNLSSADTFQQMMQIHAEVPYRLNLALSELLLNNPGGADILHMTDYVADTGSSKHIAYAASKAALQNMTLSFARQLAPKVKVNAIAPSLIMFNPDDDEDYRRKTLKKSLMQIEPGAQTVVDTVHFLLNNSYITGRVMGLDGGRHLVSR